MTRDLNDTLIFVKVVEHGSFTGAARALHIPKTTVSRKVQELEQRLGAQLLHRTTRSLGLTEAGTVYHAHGQRIASDLQDAENAVGELQGGARGWLRVAASYSMAAEWISPLLGALRGRHPELRVELVMDALCNQPVDLVENAIDVALRVGDLPDSTLAARRLGTLHTHLYASPAYLERHGEPLAPEDLLHHRTLPTSSQRRAGEGFAWSLRSGTRQIEARLDPEFVANDPAGVRSALVAGQGVVLSSELMMAPLVATGAVRRVLRAWEGPTYPLNAVFPRGRVPSPKVRAFVDFIVERFASILH